MAFTIKELREMLHIQDCKACFDLQDFKGMSQDLCKTLQRPRKRLTELLFKSAMEGPTQKQLDLWGSHPSKSWHLKLLRSPEKIHLDNCGQVCGMTLGINQLVGTEFTESQKVEVSLLNILVKITCFEDFLSSTWHIFCVN